MVCNPDMARSFTRVRADALRVSLAGGAILFSAHACNSLGDGDVPVVGTIEHAFQDYVLTRLRGPVAPSGDVVIVGIDERSLRVEGRWPWTRPKMAALVDAMSRGGVAV